MAIPCKVKASDILRYAYQDGTNRLDHVTDNVVNSTYADDFEAGQLAGNYSYDASGNLTADIQEEIADIQWTASGKVRSITRTTNSSKPDLYFEYDAMDNRILKLVKPRSNGQLTIESECGIHLLSAGCFW